jgi:hypothetical protein
MIDGKKPLQSGIYVAPAPQEGYETMMAVEK